MVIGARVLKRATYDADTTDAERDPNVLIDRVALGDEHAFANLYEIIVGPIFGIVTRILRDHARSEEVTQEILLEIWLKAAQFSAQGGNVMSWATTIAHRRAIDRVRYEQAACNREDLAEQLEIRRPVDDVVETTMAKLEQRQVRKALGSLTELQRQSIVLAYYENYSCREVSEALDTPVGTVKTRVRDGLIRLRACLGALA